LSCTAAQCSKEEVIGNNPSILHSGKQPPSFYRQMWQQLQSEGQWQSKIWNRRKNGEIYPELLSITAVLGSDEKPAYYVGIFSDISEQVNLEQQLQQAQKMETIGTLVGRHRPRFQQYAGRHLRQPLSVAQNDAGR